MRNAATHLVATVLVGASFYSSHALSHANFVPPGVDGKREYPEGQRQFLRLNLAHDCGHGDVHNPTLATMVVFPNGTDAEVTIGGEQVNVTDYLYTNNPYVPASPLYTAPAIFGIKPSVDADWKEIFVARNATPEYYNHGANTEDVGHIQWYGGYVPNEKMENLEFVATFPKFTETTASGDPNCVTRMRVYMPSIQYCTNGAINAWLLGDAVGPLADAIAADKHGLISNSGAYATYVDVVRADPVDESCSEETLTVYPSDRAVIEAQLEWTAKTAKKALNKAAIKRVRLR